MPDAPCRESRALFWDDYSPGMEWLTPARTVTRADIALWSQYTGAAPYLPDGGEGGCLLPQAAFAIATGLEQRLGLKDGTGLAFLSARFACPRPIPAGTTLMVRQQLTERMETRNPERGLLRFAVRLEDHGRHVYQDGEWLLMVRRRAGAAAATPGHKARAAGAGAPPGADMVRSPWRTVTSADILRGSQLSGDYNPVHTDDGAARAAGFAGPILQGPAGAAIAAGLLSRLQGFDDGQAEIAAVDWTFHRPILAGMNVRLEAGRSADPARPGRETLHLALLDRDGEKLQSGDWTIRRHQRVPMP